MQCGKALHRPLVLHIFNDASACSIKAPSKFRVVYKLKAYNTGIGITFNTSVISMNHTFLQREIVKMYVFFIRMMRYKK
jgi:hypothetical protein